MSDATSLTFVGSIMQNKSGVFLHVHWPCCVKSAPCVFVDLVRDREKRFNVIAANSPPIMNIGGGTNISMFDSRFISYFRKLSVKKYIAGKANRRPKTANVLSILPFDVWIHTYLYSDMLTFTMICDHVVARMRRESVYSCITPPLP